MPAVELYDDILLQIFKALGETPGQNTPEIHTTLRSASLACHRWTSSAQTVLYRTCNITMQHEVLGGAATTRVLFARTMSSSPHVRPLVRELYLNIGTSQYPLQLSWLNLLPPGRLLKAHILFSEGRSIQGARFHPWILGFPAIRSVHHLKLHCSLQPRDFEVCFGLPNVQSLDLSRPANGTWCLPTLATLPPTLERLTLSADDMSRPRVAARLVGMVALAPSVRELSIKTGELGLKGAFSPIAEQLVRIRHLRVLELEGRDVKKLYPDRLVEAIVNRNRWAAQAACMRGGHVDGRGVGADAEVAAGAGDRAAGDGDRGVW